MQRPRPVFVVLLAATILCALIDHELKIADQPIPMNSVDAQADADSDTGRFQDL